MKTYKFNLKCLPLFLILILPFSDTSAEPVKLYECPTLDAIAKIGPFNNYQEVSYKGINWILKGIQDSGADYVTPPKLIIDKSYWQSYSATDAFFPTMVCDAKIRMAPLTESIKDAPFRTLRVMYGPAPSGYKCTVVNEPGVSGVRGFSCEKQ